MDPFIALVLVGLVATGAAILAFFFFALLFALCAIVLWAIAVIAVAVGLIGDARYNRKMNRGQAPYRLPFYYRWKGWRIGSMPDVGYGYKSSMAFDSKRNRFIGMYRQVHEHERQ